MIEHCTYCGHKYGSFWKTNRGTLLERKKIKDHLVPKSMRGTAAAYNIIHCCNRCNSFKGQLSLQDWAEMIKYALDNATHSGVARKKGQTSLLGCYKKSTLIVILKNVRKILQPATVNVS